MGPRGYKAFWGVPVRSVRSEVAGGFPLSVGRFFGWDFHRVSFVLAVA